MANFLKHFRGSRKRTNKGNDLSQASPVVTPIDDRINKTLSKSDCHPKTDDHQHQHQHHHYPHLSLKWCRRRNRGGSEDSTDSKSTNSNKKGEEPSLPSSTTWFRASSPSSKSPARTGSCSASSKPLSPCTSAVSTTPPLTPETTRVTSSVTTAPTNTTSTSAPSASALLSLPKPAPPSARYEPFVPEEKVAAVQLALAHHLGTASLTSIEEEGGFGGEEFWNDITRAVTALDKAGNDLFAQGDYDGAFLRYERALLLKRSTLHPQQQYQLHHPSSSQSQQHHHQQQQPQQAHQLDRTGDQQHQNQQQPRADIVASVATSINNMTYLQQRAGLMSADESIASYFKSLQMKREFLGPSHLSVGKTLNNIGSVFYLKKEYPQALQAYQDARRIMEDNLGSHHGDVGTVISNIGDVYFILHQYPQALEQYRAALKIRWAALGPIDPKVIRLMDRIAALETRKQPVKDEGYMSDSDSEEYLQEDEMRYSLFKEDLQTLQAELNEDMKFFDLLERESAINMVRDKMDILRELREMSHSLDQQSWEDCTISLVPSASSAESCNDAHPCANVEHGAGQRAIAHATLAPVSAVQEESPVSVVQAASRSDAPSSSRVIEEDTADESSPNLSSFPAVVTSVSLEAPSSEHVAARPVIANRDLHRSSSDLSSGPIKYPPTYSGLTAEDRRKALATVQERLAKLRAERECVSESSGVDSLTEATCEQQPVVLSSGAAKSSSPRRRSFLYSAEKFQQHQLKRAQILSNASDTTHRCHTANGAEGRILMPPASTSTTTVSS